MDGILKIHKLEDYNIVIGYWGSAPSNSTFQSILDGFESDLDNTGENVDTVGNKLKEYLQTNYPGYNREMGLHKSSVLRNKYLICTINFEVIIDISTLLIYKIVNYKNYKSYCSLAKI